MIDDAYYCLQISYDLAYGKRITFDGLTTSSGFQPLWLLLIVIFHVLTGNKLVVAQSVTIAQVLLFRASVSFFGLPLSHSKSWEIVGILN